MKKRAEDKSNEIIPIRTIFDNNNFEEPEPLRVIDFKVVPTSPT